jgi:hypothetical protein
LPKGARNSQPRIVTAPAAGPFHTPAPRPPI